MNTLVIYHCTTTLTWKNAASLWGIAGEYLTSMTYKVIL